mgnify:CR=1 FL=1
MNFKYYEVISHLIPGYLIYQVVVILYPDLPKIDIIPSIAIAYILGYVNNALSSWVESFIYWSWGGKPSTKLLQGKGTYKVKFYEADYARKLLKEELTDEYRSEDQLFGIAMRYSDYENSERVKDFNASYAFSRSLLISICICSIVILINYYQSLMSYIVLIPLIVILWFRAKDRGYYYA